MKLLGSCSPISPFIYITFVIYGHEPGFEFQSQSSVYFLLSFLFCVNGCTMNAV